MSISQDILDFEDLRRKEVEVKEWKRTVTIQELGLQESMRAFSDLETNEDGSVHYSYKEIAQLVAFGVIDPKTGERIFSDDEVPELSRKSRPALKHLHDEIMKLSGTVEDEVKN